MTRLKVLLSGIFGVGLAAVLWIPSPLAFAAVDVDLDELRRSSDLIAPKQSLLPALPGYGNFEWIEATSTPKGLAIRYEAPFLADAAVSSELPRLQVATIVYPDQSSAHSAYTDLLTLAQKHVQWELTEETSQSFWVKIESSTLRGDPFKILTAESRAFHRIEQEGNLVFQYSLYREGGLFDQSNASAYLNATTDLDSVRRLIDLFSTDFKARINSLFPPSQFIFHSTESRDSYKLTKLQNIPLHGSIEFTVYIEDFTSAAGTLIDSSGVDKAHPGDLYLYLDADGELRSGIYAPFSDASCEQEDGWYRIKGQDNLELHQWNSVILDYGIGGFALTVNGILQGSCQVGQERSDREVFLGDYPNDLIEEGFIGWIGRVVSTFKTTHDGRIWDEILKEQLFLDVSNDDPDLILFDTLKWLKIMSGNNGELHPERLVNRAEAVKMLVRLKKLPTRDDWTVSFPDVPPDAWYGRYLEVASERAWIFGLENGDFNPEGNLTVRDLQSILNRQKQSVSVLAVLGWDQDQMDTPLRRRDMAHVLNSLLP